MAAQEVGKFENKIESCGSQARRPNFGHQCHLSGVMLICSLRR